MMLSDPITLLFLAGVSMAAAGFSVFAGSWLARAMGTPGHVMLQGLDLPRSYMFRDGYLLTDIDDDDAFLSDPTDRVGAWKDLTECLGGLNTDAVARMNRLREKGETFVLIGKIGEDSLSITGRRDEDQCVITVAALDARRAKRTIDQAGLDALEHEVELLRTAMDHCNAVMWRAAEDGQITWANAAYYTLLEEVDEGTGALVWPIKPVFGDHTTPPPEEGRVRRCSLEVAGQKLPLWFDISMTEQGIGTLYTARPIDQLVAAETSLRDFVQTLSRTFAHLPIGLAIFDQRRKLVLFNPALVELSTLSSEWLSTRPDLFSFLDQLREHQRMPEPKNYHAWRAEMAELEQAARDGTYQDLWTLPTGQTFRVIGRPHADGAVAFMFEDITSEVSLTRQFRGDLELYQAIMDETEEAMAVFSNEGQLTLRNTAYGTLWGTATTDAAMINVIDATRAWADQSEPTPLWGEIRNFVTGYSERSPWSETLVLQDGRVLRCRVAPLKGGATLVVFEAVEGATLPQAIETAAAISAG
jgi:PAS domain-containing protein